MTYYVIQAGAQIGPFSEEQLKAEIASGKISPTDLVWWEGQQGWQPLSQTLLSGTTTISTPQAIPVTGVMAALGSAAAPRTSQLALWALICGCLGIMLSFLAGIPAIILGHLGRGETKNNPNLSGYGMATAGMILGYFFTLLLPLISVISIAVLIALGNQVKSTFSTINAQIQSAEMTNSADQSTNSETSNSATTNSAPATNVPASNQ